MLVAIRENEQRARFIGYPTDRYKLFAFTVSAAITALAGTLSVFHHRFASAEPISVAFSGELLAMVVIGGMRSFLGPALGALFFILFREFLSIWTPNWLLFFGLLFVGFIVFSPTGLVGVAERVLAPFRKREIEAAAMAGRAIAQDAPLPAALAARKPSDGPVLIARELAKSFGGIRAVANADIVVADRTLHALIGPNGAGKTTAFNLLSGMFPPDVGFITVAGQPVTGFGARGHHARRRRALVPDHQPVRRPLGRGERAPCRAGAAPQALRLVGVGRRHRRGQCRDRRVHAAGSASPASSAPRPASLSYGGQRLLDMGLALATAPHILLLDEPLAGLAAAERTRVAALVKSISRQIPVLLVEHDIDRVFQIADVVTVMNEGAVLVHGSVDEARNNAKVREIYIGSGTAHVTAEAPPSAAGAATLLSVDKVDTFYGKSHILNARLARRRASTRSSRCSAATAPANPRC